MRRQDVGKRRFRGFEGLSDREMYRVAVQRTVMAVVVLVALNGLLKWLGLLTTGEALAWVVFMTCFVGGSLARQIRDERRKRSQQR